MARPVGAAGCFFKQVTMRTPREIFLAAVDGRTELRHQPHEVMVARIADAIDFIAEVDRQIEQITRAKKAAAEKYMVECERLDAELRPLQQMCSHKIRLRGEACCYCGWSEDDEVGLPRP